MTISYRANDVRSRPLAALVGMLADSAPMNATRTFINSNPQAVDVWTVLVATNSSSTDYTITIDDVACTYSSDASATKAEIADGIAAAIMDDPLVGAGLNAISDGVDTVTITGITPGQAFVITDNSADLTTTHVTTADEADSISFGRLLVSTGYDVEDGVETVGLAAAALLTAQVDSWAVTYENGVILNAEVTVDGVSYSGSVTMGTDLNASLDALVAVVNADEFGLPANSVIATSTPATATSFVFTSEVAGKAFTSRMWLGVGAAAAAPALTRTAPASSDVNRVACGISMYTSDEEITDIEGTEAVYPANGGVIGVTAGPVWVDCAQTINPGDAVYVELGVTADNGKFFNTSSATRVRLTRATWERDGNSDGDDIAVVRFS